MRYWLLKSEPQDWSWTQQCARGEIGEWWDGVRNYQAANNLRAMRSGDLGFFYHSGKKPQIVGVVEITKEAKPDPSDSKGRFVMVCVKAKYPLAAPVSLSLLRQKIPSLVILRQSRLSVSELTIQEWRAIIQLSQQQT